MFELNRLFSVVLLLFFINADCCCMQFLDDAVFCRDTIHHRKTEQVFQSSFLQYEVDEIKIFNDCIKVMSSCESG